jgi:hypothetical protein
MAALIANNVDAHEMGVASGMNTVVRMVGSVIGGQVAAALLTAQTIGNSSIPAESAYTITFAVSAVAALAAAESQSRSPRSRSGSGSPKPRRVTPPAADARSSSRRTHDQPAGQRISARWPMCRAPPGTHA